MTAKGSNAFLLDPVPDLNLLVLTAGDQLLRVSGQKELEDVVGVHTSYLGNNGAIVEGVLDHALVAATSGKDAETILSKNKKFLRVFSDVWGCQVELAGPGPHLLYSIVNFELFVIVTVVISNHKGGIF